MEKERLTAFTDAVLAIIMTILVLELKKPEFLSWQGFWALRLNFFAYALSFFWIGLLWYNHHNAFAKIRTVNKACVFWTIVMLFFMSLFPYATSIVASHFSNKSAQVFYGIIMLGEVLSNMVLTNAIRKENPAFPFRILYEISDRVSIADVVFKLIAILLSATIFPEAVLVSVCLSLLLVEVGSLFH